MVEQGYLQARPNRPATLGLVILGHVAALAAVVLIKGPEVIPLPTVLKTYTVPPDITPPPEPVPPQPKAQQPKSRIDTPIREIQLPQLPDTTVIETPRLPPLPPMPPLPPSGGEIAPRPADPPAPPALVDAAPDPRAQFQPAYPAALQRAEVEGRATVRVLIGSDGRVHAVEIVSADDPAFAEATRKQALRSWRFKPATRDGVPVESWRTMTVHFRMNA
ncbi:energy transducer TonB [Sphingomonas jatrophae]|uniref:Protein TonB n=1 Tax=Sphingomonas jatrophae TaxID=1166337 RepID=A0A1I6LQ95_9SPHN|nr:energy transducer TonB [Sphingomonas jatrophae]SFS05578.1 protein TonB [Sphingomonas jatrophae]